MLSPGSALLLALALGLCAGFLDDLFIVYKKYASHREGYFRTARDFPWSVPVGHVVLMMVPGMVLAGLTRFRPGLVSLRVGSWLLAALAIWSATVRLPLHFACPPLIAAGLGRHIGSAIAARGSVARRLRWAVPGLLGVLAVLWTATSGRELLAERLATRGLSSPPTARNVVLIVWDTVRAYNLDLYGYPRVTSPNLTGWARLGVRYRYAMAPAPWTYPSHASFLTGQWPMATDSQWKFHLDTAAPTLAEYLSSRGYQTAGFVANTNCCTYESGLGRGFAHYDDYPLSTRSLLTRTVAGRWALEEVLKLAGRFHDAKWAALQSRDAKGITDAFLDWLGQRRTDRPFFAFLNYFDAHEPYVPSPEFAGRYGIKPKTGRDYHMLYHFIDLGKPNLSMRDIEMARDCYDDSIAYLDKQLGRLLNELSRQGVLDETMVIITSDHGEAFAEHGVLGHSYSLDLSQIGVPLVILAPGATAGQAVSRPVSLRDLPATVVDRLGLGKGSPFPGGSLAAYWGLRADQVLPEATSTAFSEQANRMAFRPEPGPGGLQPGFQMSVVVSGCQYIRGGTGKEHFFDLVADPYERVDFMQAEPPPVDLGPYRKALLKVLADTHASPEVERGYLDAYRSALEAQVRAADARQAGLNPQSVPVPGNPGLPPAGAVAGADGAEPVTGLAVDESPGD